MISFNQTLIKITKNQDRDRDKNMEKIGMYKLIKIQKINRIKL
jgi:hypothetical protein